MSVRCRQSADGVVQEYVIVPHAPDQTDADLFAAKKTGAKGKGWKVRKTGPSSFTATKVRWGGIDCVREFWID